MSKSVSVKPKKKVGLGRGLGSLLGENTKEQAFTEEKKERAPMTRESLSKNIQKENLADVMGGSYKNKVLEVPIEKIKPNKDQPRKIFDDQKLLELSLSIKQKGVIQPILVRKAGPEIFEIIAGERRWRASQKAGLKQVPVIIKEYDDKEVLEVALIENIQRNDLNPIEEAEALKYLIQKYKMTQEQLSEKLGRERSSITNLLRLLSLSPAVKRGVLENKVSLGQAKVILSLSDWSQQERVLKDLNQKKYSVRELERIVKKLKTGKLEGASSIPEEDLNSKLVKGLSQELQKLLGQKVKIDYSKGKGEIKISFHSDEELNAVINKIRKSWK